jgi:putative transport protein
MGAIITFLPLFIVGFGARYFYKTNYMQLCGLLAGSMTDPPALAFASEIANSDGPAITYATVYPMVMFLRILTAQLFVIILSQFA